MLAVDVTIASPHHTSYAEEISLLIESAAKVRGTGIAKRSPAYLIQKIEEGKAIITLDEQGGLAGFCYVESWGHQKFVANSGLIIKETYRGLGLAKKIKEKAFELSRQKFPNAKLFGLTTSLPVMKINSQLGYEPVTYSELTDDEQFWKGCQSCVNHDILMRNEKKRCICTAMLYNPKKKNK